MVKVPKTCLLIVTLIQGCISHKENTQHLQTDSIVHAIAETMPVLSGEGEDAADDPAIWVNRLNPEKSLIIGTNKKAGLYVYNLQGEEVSFYRVGRVNNVDIRYDFRLRNGRLTDIIGASNRSDNSIIIMAIDPESYTLFNIQKSRTLSSLSEVYGFTFYHDKRKNRYYAFVCAKDGATEQWELVSTVDNRIELKIVRKFSFESQTEGLVADDYYRFLYAAEEHNCIWKVPADPESLPQKTRIAMSDSLNPRITYDLEGLTIYYADRKNGYLIASIQGNSSYALFEREGNNRYIGSFLVGPDITDGVEDTDGIDVCARSLGILYPHGILVVQDGFNYDGDFLSTQNFKIVGWEKIAGLFKPALFFSQ
jgi:3-phytase